MRRFLLPRARGFTLVELLVVIGLIAVLIAILLPVLHKVRQQAQQAVCASNMRQLALAALMYAAENRGILPIPLGIAPPPGPFPFDAIGVDAPGKLNWQRGALWPYIARDVGTRQRIFLCPSDAEPRLLQGQGSDLNLHLLPGTSRNFSYGYNYYLAGPNGEPPNVRYGVRLSQIYQPSHKLLVMEDEGPRGPSAGVSGLSGPNGEVLVFLTKRHNGMCNVCCFDGHVEALSGTIFENPGTAHWNYIATPTYEHYVDIFADR